ncbi:MAG: PAS domain-containing protein [Hyphomicrobiaceae bacterium]|nr:PAS domain-containing protein [Hyphomicrobiaceae bacterium]
MLRRVVGVSPEVIYVYHVPWRRIAFLGHRVREVLGFASSRSHRFKLVDFEGLVHPADLVGFRRHLAAIERAADGEILSRELRIKGTDGRYRWLRSRDTVLARTDGGAVAKVVGAVANIDEVKRAPAADAVSWSRLDDVLATIGDCYVAVDRHLRIVDMNAEAESWLKVRREDVIGHTYGDIVAPPADLAEAVQKAIEERLPRRMEMQSRRRPGTWLDLHIHPSRGGASVLFRDITERKRAEREAARSRQLLQSSLDTLSTQIAILDEAGTIVATNKAWEGQFGAQALWGAGVGSDHLVFCDPARRDTEARGLCKELRSVLSGEKKTARLAYSAEAGGQRRWFQLSAARFEWDGDIQLIVANEDLTDVRQAKEALSELSGRLSALREEERQRIAQELHDSTAQHLVAATLNLMTLKAKSLSYPGVHKLLENVESSLEEATRELRVFTYLLHPLALENDGLEKTLRNYLDGFGRRTRMDVQLSVAGNIEDLPFALQCGILRIIQEALANVHRHAAATHVSVALKMTPGALRLVFADDGRGMPGEAEQGEAGPVRRGMGIPGMRSRLRDFGGSLAIRSGSHGTTLSAFVPLSPANHWSPASDQAPLLAVALDGNPHQT